MQLVVKYISDLEKSFGKLSPDCQADTARRITQANPNNAELHRFFLLCHTEKKILTGLEVEIAFSEMRKGAYNSMKVDPQSIGVNNDFDNVLHDVFEVEEKDEWPF